MRAPRRVVGPERASSPERGDAHHRGSPGVDGNRSQVRRVGISQRRAAVRPVGPMPVPAPPAVYDHRAVPPQTRSDPDGPLGAAFATRDGDLGINSGVGSGRPR